MWTTGCDCKPVCSQKNYKDFLKEKNGKNLSKIITTKFSTTETLCTSRMQANQCKIP